MEFVEELVAAVGDKGGKVDAVSQLEGEDRRGVVGAEAPQLGHRSNPPQELYGGRPTSRPSFTVTLTSDEPLKSVKPTKSRPRGRPP